MNIQRKEVDIKINYLSNFSVTLSISEGSPQFQSFRAPSTGVREFGHCFFTETRGDSSLRFVRNDNPFCHSQRRSPEESPFSMKEILANI